MPLVGRSAELTALRAALDGVARDAGGCWLVAVPGGIGKSRRGKVLLEEATRRGWSTTDGRAFPAESGVPYALFAEALQPIVRHFDAAALQVLTRGVGELTRIFPWLGGPMAAGEPPSPDFRSRLHWHFAQFLRGLAERQPLVVVLEDRQWADTSSLELLHFVARHTTDTPLLLYCTYKPEMLKGGIVAALEETVRQRLDTRQPTGALFLQAEARQAVRPSAPQVRGSKRGVSCDGRGLTSAFRAAVRNPDTIVSGRRS
jgi:predicted ATPase